MPKCIKKSSKMPSNRNKKNSRKQYKNACHKCCCSSCCNNNNNNNDQLDKRTRCHLLVSYTLEVFLILLLFFMLPHAVYGIVAATPSTQQAEIAEKSVQQNGAGEVDESLFREHKETHFQKNRTGIVELFAWKFSDVGKECEEFLGPKGYAGVQLSPVTEHLLPGIPNAQTWLTFYQPVSYKFATRLGSIEDFLEMSRVCNTAGVRVYVDVVLNHMVGELANVTLLEGLAGSLVNVSALNYTGVPYSEADFHKPCQIENYMDAHEVRNCQLNGQPDLDHSKEQVKERIVDLLNELIGMGVAGFKIEAAKHIWPVDLRDIYAAVRNLNSEEYDFPADARPFFYQEVVDLGVDSVSRTEYAGYGIVAEYLYAAVLSTIFKGENVPLSTLINWGPAMGFLQHQDALVFVDTRESQHGYLQHELGQNQLLSYRQKRKYVMATVFMLAHPYGSIKRIMSSYRFDDEEESGGPPMETITINNNDDAGDVGNVEADNLVFVGIDDDNVTTLEMEVIRSPVFDEQQQCTPESGWVCEHRWPAIVNMLTLSNDLNPIEDGVINFQTFGPNHIAFCRGQKAFIAFNNDEVLDYATTVHTCLEPGVYCDVISGGRTADGSDCIGKRITVNELGMADLLLPAIGAGGGGGDGEEEDGDYGVIAIYVNSKLKNCQLNAGETAQKDAADTADLESATFGTLNEGNDTKVETEAEELNRTEAATEENEAPQLDRR